jgi:hypothetical protein
MTEPLVAEGLSIMGERGRLTVRLHDADGEVVAIARLRSREALNADLLWASAVERVKTGSPSRGTH